MGEKGEGVSEKHEYVCCFILAGAIFILAGAIFKEDG